MKHVNVERFTTFPSSEWIHLEDGNSSVCKNIVKPSKFDTAYPKKLKLYIEQKLWKLKDKNIKFVFN
jgi:hypothetical protein